jgi:S-DNA-T family DNA segregation ATPase FtsK/SpoIIIE
LPSRVAVHEVTASARVAARPWLLPVGIGERALQPISLVLHDGEHALVAGPPRSGRSTALLTVAAGFRAAAPDGLVVVLAGPRSPLRGAGLVAAGDAVGAVAALERAAGPALLLVDDAETVDDDAGALRALISSSSGSVTVVTAGRADALRAAYGHWTRELRRSGVGLLLQADADLDGELLGASLPRRPPVALAPGRGWLCRPGAVEVAQVAS